MHQRQYTPLPARFSSRSVESRPAPPVYHPRTSAASLQPKLVTSPQSGVPTMAWRPPAASPNYRPYQSPKAAPRVITTSRAAAIQLSSSKKAGFSTCGATIISSSGISGQGSYKRSIHAEINALENYLKSGGQLGDITSIDITSQPCKYCDVILGDLGIREKVNAPGDRAGSCQGGSYGWFDDEGFFSKALQAALGMNQHDCISSIIRRVH